jgi:triosephosphate isomerase
MTERQPMAVANWKMEMTISATLAFVRRFQARASGLLAQVQVVLCPPFTALYPLAQALGESPIELGGQSVSAAAGGAHTGEISARLVADAGGRWALLGHWELRRHLGENDAVVNHKVHRALDAGLGPILLLGEGRDVNAAGASAALDRLLGRVLAGCAAEQVVRMVFIYEPEWTIGVAEPAPPVHVGAGCRFIRRWLADRFGGDTARAVRILYGGSVSASHARDLLAMPDVDGLGAGRKGRDPDAFYEIVRLIAEARASHA